ncbi:MAG: hypothetical protein Q8O93_04530 [bacterium]|nr:hypothetical protein [bacterium]
MGESQNRNGRDIKTLEELGEGFGAVVYPDSGGLVIYTRGWEYNHPYWREYLTKAKTAAKFSYGFNAFIIWRHNGRLVCDDVSGKKFLKEVARASVSECPA